MDLFIVLASLGAFALIVWLYHVSVTALNQRAEATYRYRPINITSSLVATAAYVVTIVGILMGGDNVAVGLVTGLLLFLFLFLRVASKTSLLVAFLAFPLLAIGGLGLLIIIVLLYLVFGQKKQEKP